MSDMIFLSFDVTVKSHPRSPHEMFCLASYFGHMLKYFLLSQFNMQRQLEVSSW